jgi:hypothetical protein
MATYKTLFLVEFKHDYYPSGYTADFDVVPTPKTATELKGSKLLFKPNKHGFSVLYIEDDITGQPKIDVSTLKMSFRMLLKEPLFINFTDLDDDYRRLVIDRFTNANGEGRFRQTSEALTAEDKTANVFANLEVNDVGSDVGEFPLKYRIDYDAMRRYWEYYVVLRSDDDVQLRMVDSEIDFSESRYPKVRFRNGRIRIIGDEVRTMYFKSTRKVKTFKEAKQKITLEQNTKLNDNDKDYDVIIEHMPNPEIRSLNSTVYVYI